MTIHLRSLLLGSCALLVGCGDQGQDLTKPAQPFAAAVKLGATPLARDKRGIPHLIRGGEGTPKLQGATATDSARMHLERLAPSWGLRSATSMPQLDALGEVEVAGGTVVRFRQVIDGLPVEPTAGGELHVMVQADGTLVGIGGKMVATDTPHSTALKFADDEAGAIARAVGDKYKAKLTSRMLSRVVRQNADGSHLLAGQDASGINVSMSRAHQAWWPTGKTLLPVWVVEAYSSAPNSTDADAYRTVIATSGRIISRTNLRASDGASFQYRVFVQPGDVAGPEFHPSDGPIVDSSPNTAVPMLDPNMPRVQPALIAPTLLPIVGTNHPTTGSPDAWLTAGSTMTMGNNVHTYTDANPPDGLTTDNPDPTKNDFYADVTAAGVFDRSYDFTKGAIETTDNQKAGITSLFYLINWMHDFWYDGGFTEAAGNGQDDNYGRGGQDKDAVLGEAQDNAKGPDGGSRDNANMATPADGMPGKMQVYVWDNLDNRTLHKTGDTTIIGTATAAYGPGTFNLNLPIALAKDAAGKTDGCATQTVDFTNQIAVIDRGTCSFETKTLNAQLANAKGVIVINNVIGEAIALGVDDTIMTPPTIPSLSVAMADGAAIRAAVGTNYTMSRDPGPDLDGTLDITVVGHEYGHFVHHRLSVCNTQLCGAMSEGWADFSALLVSSRQGDNFDQQFPLGIFSTRGSSLDPVYYGIRRAPYTTNHDVNPLSFRHMAVGAALPPPPGFNAGDPMDNNEVHNAGEVWASMLWEGYATLQKQPGADFNATRLKMRQYEVAGLMLAPPDATPTETRDAILMAVKAASPTDYGLLAAAYAKRGFGSCAASPDRDSLDFNPIVESADIKGNPNTGELDSENPIDCDSDQVLDPGEEMTITVPVTNNGAAIMHGTTATLSSDQVVFDNDADRTQSLGDIAIFGQATATFTVKLAPTVTKPTESDVMIAISSTDGCTMTMPVPLTARFDTDDKKQASATDSFDAGISVWVPSHVMQGTNDTDELWTHERVTGLNGVQIGVDQDGPSDASLTSPDLKAGSGDLTMTFQTAYVFEFSPDDGSGDEMDFDGGVIEYSTDEGKTWQDISTLADPGYNVTLFSDPTDSPPNPLAGRKAFGAVNASFPNLDTVAVDLGTQLKGKTFQIRFRVGSDANTGAPGWYIDNVVFTGLDNTPFPTLVADNGNCDKGGGCCQTGSGMATGNVVAAFGVLGLIIGRRRRRAKRAAQA